MFIKYNLSYARRVEQKQKNTPPKLIFPRL